MKENGIDNQLKNRRIRWAICFFLLAILAVVFFVVSVMFGSTSVSVNEITTSVIVRQIRLPRAIMVVILGGALAVSGFLLQTFFDNPLAGPYVLGISSASKVAVAIVMIFFISSFGKVSKLTLIIAAFFGAMISTWIILIISKKVNHIASLLVAGIMIGYVCSAISDFIVTFAKEEDIVSMHDWSVGSFSGSNMNDVILAAVICGLAILVTLFFSRALSAFRLGEEYALSMGVDVGFLKKLIIVVSALLSATVTAFAGPISFVGIAVPILTRKIFNTSEPVIIIPGTFLCGAVFCMISDFISRMAFAPTELAISSVTAILGAPVVIAVLIKRTK